MPESVKRREGGAWSAGCGENRVKRRAGSGLLPTSARAAPCFGDLSRRQVGVNRVPWLISARRRILSPADLRHCTAASRPKIANAAFRNRWRCRPFPSRRSERGPGRHDRRSLQAAAGLGCLRHGAAFRRLPPAHAELQVPAPFHGCPPQVCPRQGLSPPLARL